MKQIISKLFSRVAAVAAVAFSFATIAEAAEVTIATATFDGKNANYTQGWTTTGTGKGRTDCVIIGSGENITSPSFDFSGYSEVTITFTGRRYGSLSGSKATVNASIGGTSVGTIDFTSTSVSQVSGGISFVPTSSMTSAVVVFTCTNATSPGSSHGAGVGSITIKGTPKGSTPTETVATPSFNPAAGTYTSVQSVIISTETQGATIYYTTNGSNPTTNSSVYSSPISVSTNTTIKAMAVKEGMNNSAIATAAYTINISYSGPGYARVGSLRYLTEGAKVIIAARYNSTSNSYYAMTAAATGKPSGVSFTSTTSSLGEVLPSTILNNESTYYWTVGVTDNGYTFTNANNQALGYTSGTNFVIGGDNTSWAISRKTSGGDAMVEGYEGFYITNVNTSGRGVALNSQHNFGPYAISNDNSEDYNFYVDIFVEGVTPVADPSIASSNLDLDYDATSGSLAFSLTNPVEGGVVTATSSDNWLTIGTVSANAIALSCAVNNTATERSSTVTLTYTYNTNQSVTKEVTVTQAANPNIIPTISEVRAQGSGSAFTKGVVTTITGSGAKTAYIQDATAAIVVYGDFTASVGDEIRVSGTLSTFNGLLEITNPTVTVLSQNNTVTPTVMTIAEINSSSNQGWYVKIEDATVTAINDQNTTISQGENSIVVRGISEDVEYGINDIITLEGNIGCYNTVQISNPTNVSVREVIIPTITVTPATVSVPAAPADPNEYLEGTMDLTYANLTISDMTDFAVQFYDADGEEIDPSEVSWIYALVAEQDPEVGEGYVVSYGLENNDGAARTAYFKVYALGDEDYVYSNLVTVTQAAPVIDYATLPFEYDGNGTGTLPSGFTVSGLGTYGSSPAMKFDGTGDYAILKFNEAPGILTFDIKGNSFSGGTFTVQTSADGVNYSDLVTYTELSSTQNEEFDNLPETARYIKWVYTNKSSGNVALGNIKLAKKQAAAPETYSLTLTAGDGGYWGTFFNGVAGYVLPDGAQAFTMNADKQLYRLGENNARGKYIPANTAVVIISDVSEITLTKGESAEPVSPNGGANILQGSDFSVAKTGNQYVLGKKNNVIGFFKFTGTSIPANKAYYVVSE